MINILKSDFRKLLTVRSTYIGGLIALLLITFLSLYIAGYRGLGNGAASVGSSLALRQIASNASSIAAQVVAIIVILFMAHEYRYNTINYTLTAANSRSKVLLSKMIVATVYSLIFTYICVFIAGTTYRIGFLMRGTNVLQPQALDFFTTLGRLSFYAVGLALTGLLLTVLVRSVIASIIAIFMVPATLEPLATIFLKEKGLYLPFAALQRVSLPETTIPSPGLSPGRAALVFTVYLVVAWALTWVVFLRRDAN